jgi:predicted transcriptional regulator
MARRGVAAAGREKAKGAKKAAEARPPVRAFRPDRMVKRRHELGLSQAELSLRTRISGQEISRYERGEREPTLTSTSAIADGLGCSTDWLAGRTDVVEMARR